ncbi:MAG TPA: cytochrome c oxidase assembly protein [Hyphomicrobiales bacterium]|nr:cytochrome c oxidase assembly protein [Hyphomicrobiales bacterium]
MTDSGRNKRQDDRQRSNARLASGLLVLVAAMVGLSFAAVPLYRIFCQATGYAGTTKRAEAPSATVTERDISVRFDASMSSDLDWSFKPVKRKITLKIGENRLAFFRAENLSDEKLTGSATFNVTPEIAGSYFVKVQCFCFTEQTLQPHQVVDMPVSFYIDPEIMNDPDANRIEEITLSYTFFRSTDPEKSEAAAVNQRSQPRTIENAGSSG